MPPRKTATPANLPVKWDEEMAKYADAAAKTEESVALGQFISMRAGQLSFNGVAFPDNEMDVVVMDHVMENTYYTGRYDSENPASPVCYAFGREDAEMAPHEKSAQPQNETCKGCELNEYGSSETGKGKACKNSRRLALITSDSLENLEEAQVVYMKIPVTSVKGWAQHVDSLKKSLRKPPFAVVTRVKVVPDPKSQFKVLFSLVEEIDGANFAALVAKHNLVKQSIIFPYAENSASAAGAVKGAGAATAPKGRAQTARKKF